MVTIFIEGKADQRFLEDFITFHFDSETLNKISFIDVKGKDSIHLVRNEFQKNTDQEGVNLLIFDADADFDTRILELEKKKLDLGINFETFLFPNNQNNGDLEVLLLNLTTENHKGIFECFKPFNDCLLAKDSTYNVPSLKTQVYSYLDFQNLEPKENNRNYLHNCWNLEHEFVIPLLKFIKKNYKKIPST